MLIFSPKPAVWRDGSEEEGFLRSRFIIRYAHTWIRRSIWENNVKEQFWTRIEEEMEVVNNFNIGSIDMVFFPICQSMHYYVLIVVLKRKQIVLLDNSSAQLAEPLTIKYGNFPSRVNLKIRRLHLPWSNESNKVDCGVYAMRHMKTFMGGCVKDWSVGLAANVDKVLQGLRIKYTKTLLISDVNYKCGKVLNRVRAWFSGLRSVKKVA